MPQQSKFPTGRFYSIDQEESWESDVREAVVTDEHISLDWDENGLLHHANLTSSDGYCYVGRYGAATKSQVGSMSGYLCRSKSGDYVFWLEWENHENGYGGESIAFLT